MKDMKSMKGGFSKGCANLATLQVLSFMPFMLFMLFMVCPSGGRAVCHEPRGGFSSPRALSPACPERSRGELVEGSLSKGEDCSENRIARRFLGVG